MNKLTALLTKKNLIVVGAAVTATVLAKVVSDRVINDDAIIVITEVPAQ